MTDSQATKVQLEEELVSYRAQTHEMEGTIAAFTEQHEILTSRFDILHFSTWCLFVEAHQ